MKPTKTKFERRVIDNGSTPRRSGATKTGVKNSLQNKLSQIDTMGGTDMQTVEVDQQKQQVDLSSRRSPASKASKRSPILKNSIKKKKNRPNEENQLNNSNSNISQKSFGNIEMSVGLKESQQVTQQDQSSSWFSWFLCGAQCGAGSMYPANQEESKRLSASERGHQPQRMDFRHESEGSFINIGTPQGQMPPPRDINRLDTNQTNEEIDRIMFTNKQQPPSYITKSGLQNSDDEECVQVTKLTDLKQKRGKNQDDLNATLNSLINHQDLDGVHQTDKISSETKLCYADRMEPQEEQKVTQAYGNNKTKQLSLADTQKLNNQPNFTKYDSSDESIPEEIDHSPITNTKKQSQEEQQPSNIILHTAGMKQNGFEQSPDQLTPSAIAYQETDSSAIQFAKLEKHLNQGARQDQVVGSHLRGKNKKDKFHGQQDNNDSSLSNTQEVVVVSSLEHFESTEQKTPEQISKEKEHELAEFERLEAELMVTNNQSERTTPKATGGPKLTSKVKRNSMVEGLPEELFQEQRAYANTTRRNLDGTGYDLARFQALNRSQNELFTGDSERGTCEGIPDAISYILDNDNGNKSHTPNQIKASNRQNKDQKNLGLLNDEIRHYDKSVEIIDEQYVESPARKSISKVAEAKKETKNIGANQTQKLPSTARINVQANRKSLVDRQLKQQNTNVQTKYRSLLKNQPNQQPKKNAVTNKYGQNLNQKRQQKQSLQQSSGNKTGNVSQTDGQKSLDIKSTQFNKQALDVNYSTLTGSKSNLKSAKSNSAEKLQNIKQFSGTNKLAVPQVPNGLKQSQSQSVRFQIAPLDETKTFRQTQKEQVHQVQERYGQRAKIDLSKRQKNAPGQLQRQGHAQQKNGGLSGSQSQMDAVMQELQRSLRSHSVNSVDENIRQNSTSRKEERSRQRESTQQDSQGKITAMNYNDSQIQTSNQKHRDLPVIAAVAPDRPPTTSDIYSQSMSNSNATSKNIILLSQSAKDVSARRMSIEKSVLSLKSRQSQKQPVIQVQETESDIFSDTSRTMNQNSQNLRDSVKELPFPSVQKDRNATQIALQNAPYPRLGRASLTKQSSETTSLKTAAFANSRQQSDANLAQSFINKSIKKTPLQQVHGSLKARLVENSIQKQQYNKERHQSILMSRSNFEQRKRSQSNKQVPIPNKQQIEKVRSISNARRNASRSQSMHQAKVSPKKSISRTSVGASPHRESTNRRSKVNGFFTGQGSARSISTNEPLHTQQQNGGQMFTKQASATKEKRSVSTLGYKTTTGQRELNRTSRSSSTIHQRSKDKINNANFSTHANPSGRLSKILSQNELIQDDFKQKSPFQQKRKSNSQNRAVDSQAIGGMRITSGRSRNDSQAIGGMRTTSDRSRNDSQIRKPTKNLYQRPQAVRSSLMQKNNSGGQVRNLANQSKQKVTPQVSYSITGSNKRESRLGVKQFQATNKSSIVQSKLANQNNTINGSQPEENTKMTKAYGSTRYLKTQKPQAQSGTQATLRAVMAKVVIQKPQKSTNNQRSGVKTQIQSTTKIQIQHTNPNLKQ